MIDLHNSDWSGASVKIKDAVSLTPYEYGVEYGSPARGLWNIVHTGMLLPESHQIFVCAQGCLRGSFFACGKRISGFSLLFENRYDKLGKI